MIHESDESTSHVGMMTSDKSSLVQSKPEHLNLQKSLSLNIKLLYIFGFWPKDSTKQKRLIYKVYSQFIIWTFFIFYFFLEIMNLVVYKDNLVKLAAASYVFALHISEVFKLYMLIKYQPRMKSLIDSLNREIFQPRNETQLKIITTYMMYTTKISKYFFSGVLLVFALWGLAPLSSYITGNVDEVLEIPLVHWFPINISVSPNAELVYIFIMITLCSNALTNASMDCIFLSLATHVMAQLDALSDSLENIKRFAMEKINFREGEEIVDWEEQDNERSRELADELENQLKHCVEHHRNIVQFTDEMQHVYSRGIFVQLAVAVYVLSVTMFIITMAPGNRIEVISMVFYQIAVMAENLIYCYSGDEIITKSENLYQSVYNSDWTKLSIPYKKKLLFLIVRLQKPIKLYAGSFFTVSIHTYVQILRSAWSYFAVLNSIQIEK